MGEQIAAASRPERPADLPDSAWWDSDGGFGDTPGNGQWVSGGVEHGNYQETLEGTEFRVQAVTLTGAYHHGVAAGRWELINDNDDVVASANVGTVPNITRSDALEVFSNVSRPAQQWKRLAQQMFDNERYAEGFIALARTLATDYDTANFHTAMEPYTLPATPKRAKECFAHASKRGVRAALGALVLGAHPSLVLQMLARELAESHVGRAGLELINAAILIDPTELSCLLVRARILIGLGMRDHAAIDIDEVAAAEPEQASFLYNFSRLHFARFDFWPEREIPEVRSDDQPEWPAQSLGSVQRVIRKYAHRLMLIRGELDRYVFRESDWLPPDLDHLGLDEVVLEVDELSLMGVEGKECVVRIDETLAIARSDLLDLLQAARLDWSALTYLCWAAGLNRVAMPTELRPPLTFGPIARLIDERVDACGRLLRGLDGSTEQMPNFLWEGVRINTLSQPLLLMAQEQYVETAAMFRWLRNASHYSPWQSNLRTIR